MAAAPALAQSAPDGDGDGVADGADAFPCDWRRASVSYLPSEADFTTLMFEDNWPARGDLDFNDGVVLHHVAQFRDARGATTGLRLTLIPRAVGASFRNGVALHLPLPAGTAATIVRTIDGVTTPLTAASGEADLVVVAVEALRDLFEGPIGPVNVTAGVPSIGDGAQVTVDIDFAQPVPLSLAAGLDLYFFRSEDPTHQIHLPRFGGTTTMNRALFGTADDGTTEGRAFVDTDGLPFVLAIPTQTVWPLEREGIESLWPDVVTFASSGGTSGASFYASNVQLEHAFPAPAVIGAPGVDHAACFAFACDDGFENGPETAVDCGGGCPTGCAVGLACATHDDCASTVCAAGLCSASDQRACTVAHGSGVQSRSGGSAWGACVATACDSGHRVESGACVVIDPLTLGDVLGTYTFFAGGGFSAPAVSGGVPPYTYSTTVPTGFGTMDPSTGVFTSPSSASTITTGPFTILVTDALGTSVRSGSFSVIIVLPSITLADQTVVEGAPLAATAVTNLPSPTWSVISGAPAWLALNATTGVLSGASPNITAAATHTVNVRATSGASAASRAVTITVNLGTVTVPAFPASVTPGTAISGTATTNMGTGSTFSIAGNPSWLSINAATGVISGTAVSGQPATNVVVTATRNGASATAAAFSVAVAAADCTTVGSVCSDGSVYAGLSDGIRMFATRCDAGQTFSGSCSGTRWYSTWNDGATSGYVAVSASGTPADISAAISNTDANTAAGIQINRAARYCETLTLHGRSDWYLPSRNEATTMVNAKSAIGNFIVTGTVGTATSPKYWTTQITGLGTAAAVSFVNDVGYNFWSYWNGYVRCVRRG